MRIMVIGGINADITGFSSQPVVMNDSNPGRIEIAAGGVGRNIGENLSRMGFDVGLLTAFARDPMGQFLLDRCAEAGIDTQASPVFDGAGTSIYLSAVDVDGEMVTAVSDMAILDRLGPEHLKAAREHLEAADYLVLDANLSDGMMETIFRQWRGRKLVLDPVSTRKSRKLKDRALPLELMKPNLKEARMLTGRALDTPEDLVEGLRELNERGVRWVLATDGGRGAWLSGEGRVWFCPSPQSTGCNVNGAGDAFLAGALFAHAEGEPPERMLLYGHGAASIALESAETVNPTMTRQRLKQKTEVLEKCLRIEWI